MPAACCGVYGFKPTFNRVSRQGIHPAMSSLDCVGPFAASVAMIETAMQIIDPSFHALEKLAHTPKTGLARGKCESNGIELHSAISCSGESVSYTSEI
jgi:Asp-tRNA(Asn)/Glu-tRNA(Gln) amidotransferase A subunit family amidase